MANREIKFYKHYFNEFYVAQTDKVRKKIAQTLVWLQTLDRLPVTILKSIEGKKGLFEIRVEFGGDIFRVFCCFDEGSLVILFNGFQKKAQKTPSGEIEKAERLSIMEENKKEALMNCSNLEELLNIEFGEIGTPSREVFDKETEAFCLAQTLREERKRAGLTQQELAEKIGTKKTYISRLENGKADIQLSTLFRIFEGLGRRVSLTIL